MSDTSAPMTGPARLSLFVYGAFVTVPGRPRRAAGGRTRGTSVYTRDPDGNLLEFIVYDA